MKNKHQQVVDLSNPNEGQYTSASTSAIKINRNLSKKNKLITIGYLGQKQCYLNLTEDEAIKRYCQSEGMSIEEFNENNIKINIIEFQDEFGSYDVYE